MLVKQNLNIHARAARLPFYPIYLRWIGWEATFPRVNPANYDPEKMIAELEEWKKNIPFQDPEPRLPPDISKEEFQQVEHFDWASIRSSIIEFMESKKELYIRVNDNNSPDWMYPDYFNGLERYYYEDLCPNLIIEASPDYDYSGTPLEHTISKALRFYIDKVQRHWHDQQKNPEVKIPTFEEWREKIWEDERLEEEEARNSHPGNIKKALENVDRLIVLIKDLPSLDKALPYSLFCYMRAEIYTHMKDGYGYGFDFVPCRTIEEVK